MKAITNDTAASMAAPTSALPAQLRDVPFHSHHRKLHCVAFVADHAMIPQIDSNTTDSGNNLEHLLHLAGNCHVELVPVNRAPERAAKALCFHVGSPAIGGAQFTPRDTQLNRSVLGGSEREHAHG